jgi:arsenite methyltransferase
MGVPFSVLNANIDNPHRRSRHSPPFAKSLKSSLEHKSDLWPLLALFAIVHNARIGLRLILPMMIRPRPRRRVMAESAVEIQQRFSRLALAPESERKFPVGPESAKKLGYDTAEIDRLPRQVTESFAGVGNPLGLGELRPGAIVLDLGSGAGMDSILAARRVAPTGRVIGIDMTAEMLQKARRNAALVNAMNCEFRQGTADSLPVEDGSIDVVISNGVFNLCHDKPGVLAELFRVLKPGGRLQMADILLDDAVTPEEVGRKGTWSD